ncbi:hypothetical protein L208DRAFT_1483244 [Tricholoma matsutake]|nr:hypothetical protein L208DRAFT_1483244 [Tricholoma matsutake 945]
MVKKEIKCQMNVVLRKHSQKAIGTGLERQARWQNSSAPGGRSKNEVAVLTGNSANAELAAGQHAAAVIHRRLQMLTANHVPQNIANYLSDGYVGVPSIQNAHHAILIPGMFTIVLYKSWLVVVSLVHMHGKVLLGTWVQSPIFWHKSFNSLFHAVHKDMAHLQAFTFNHFTSDSFLWLLPGSANMSPDCRTLQLDEVAYAAYAQLFPHLSKLVLVLHELRKRKNANSKSKTTDKD